MLNAARATALMNLQTRWEEWYVVRYNPESGIWLAQYRGALEEAPLNANTSMLLGVMLQNDFAERQSKRPLSERMSV